MPSDRIHGAGTGAPLAPHVINEKEAVAKTEPARSRAADVDSMGPGAPNSDGGPREPAKEYMVFMPKDAGAAKPGDFEGLANLMRAKQTPEQEATSCQRRGRYVVNLTAAEASQYERAGLNVVENVEVKAPEPVEDHGSSKVFEPSNVFGRSVHGADALQARGPGWEGENALVVIADTGIAEHPDLPKTVLFDDVQTPEPTDPQRDSGRHGTHVAGIAAANGDNVRGVRGIAPKAKLAGALVLDGGSGSIATVMAGIERAIDWANSEEWKDKPVVLNMSLGAGASGSRAEDQLAQLVNEAVREHGVFVATSAGNSGPGTGTIGTPAVAEFGTAVAATDHKRTADISDDGIARFSSRGDPNGRPGQNDKPDIAAGGAAVNSTVPGDGYARLSGTSMASPQVAGGAAVLLSKAHELYEQGVFRVPPRELVKTGELLDILQASAHDFEDLPPHVDGAGDMRLDKAADLMLERHSTLHIAERETAFKEIIRGLKADDGVLTPRDQDDILHSLVELTESLKRPDDRIDFLGRAIGHFESSKNELDPSTAQRIEAVATTLAAEAAIEVAERKPLSTKEAALAWDTMMAWRTRGMEVANPYDALTRDQATELARLVDTAASNLARENRIGFLATAKEAIQDSSFEGSAELEQTIRAQAYSTFEAIAASPKDTASAVENIANYSVWLSGDKELSNRVKTRKLSAALVKSVAEAGSPQSKVAVAMNVRQQLRAESRAFGSDYVKAMARTVDQVSMDAIKDRAEHGFDTAGEALEHLKTAWEIHMEDGVRSRGEDGEFFTLLQRTIDQSSTKFVQRDEERGEFKAGVAEMLNSIKPGADDAEGLKSWRQLRRTLYTRLNEALVGGMS